jgi:hypothetical protein
LKTSKETERKARRRLRDDLELYARTVLWIRSKSGEIHRLKFNSAQRYIHEQLEQQRRETGKVRAIILKGRQQGCSTYVEARFIHRLTHSKGLRAYILTHEDAATKNLFGIAKRYIDRLPDGLTPSMNTSNANELHFDKLDSGYKVATAGSKGTGRSDTLQLFHGSEVALWPHAESHASGALQAVPGEKGTEVILESTSQGPLGVFATKWRQAVSGESDYLPIFVPWYWQTEYVMDPTGIEWAAEERSYMTTYGTTPEQMAWRRAKIIELMGVWNFRREYPATPEEAFAAEVPGALWKREQLDRDRVRFIDMPAITQTVISLDPATTSKATSDEWGIIWGAKGLNGHIYIMGDETEVLSPHNAAGRAVDVYKAQSANEIVYETNQGGDMVPTIIGLVGRERGVNGIKCTGVTASKAKRARAEPVQALCEQGKVHMVGNLTALEDELCTWDASSSNESPNRLDAFVWLVTRLLLQGGCGAVSLGGGGSHASNWRP